MQIPDSAPDEKIKLGDSRPTDRNHRKIVDACLLMILLEGRNSRQTSCSGADGMCLMIVESNT